MNFTLDLSTILQGITVAGVLYGARLLAGMARWQAEMNVALRGLDGDNGVIGDVRDLRKRAHHQGDALHSLTGRVTLVEREVEELKEARA